MEKNEFKEAVLRARSNSQKRKFKQSFDLIVTLKDINLKDTTQQVDFFVTLPFSKGKQTKICALVGTELAPQAKTACDFVITDDGFEKYARNKKLAKKLAHEYGFFIAQGNLMADIAKNFGKFLGPKGKMPNPKAGCVVPPNANLKALCDKLKTTIRVSAKTQPVVQCMVGNEDMKDDEVVENIMAIYKQILQHIPNEENNVKGAFVKLTMGKSVKVGGAAPAAEETPKAAPVKEEKAKEAPAAEKKEEKKDDSEKKKPQKKKKAKEGAEAQ